MYHYIYTDWRVYMSVNIVFKAQEYVDLSNALKQCAEVTHIDSRIAKLAAKFLTAIKESPNLTITGEVNGKTINVSSSECAALASRVKEVFRKDIGNWSYGGLVLSAIKDFLTSLLNTIMLSQEEQTWGLSSPYQILRKIDFKEGELRGLLEELKTASSNGESDQVEELKGYLKTILSDVDELKTDSDQEFVSYVKLKKDVQLALDIVDNTISIKESSFSGCWINGMEVSLYNEAQGTTLKQFQEMSSVDRKETIKKFGVNAK